MIGPFRDMFNGRNDWFSLYAIDSKIDDETYSNKVKRGLFRLHPKGPTGRSEGCIVIEDIMDWQSLRAILKNTTPAAVPGGERMAYGKVVVK